LPKNDSGVWTLVIQVFLSLLYIGKTTSL